MFPPNRLANYAASGSHPCTLRSRGTTRRPACQRNHTDWKGSALFLVRDGVCARRVFVLHVLVRELKVGDRSGVPTAEKRLNFVRHNLEVMVVVSGARLSSRFGKVPGFIACLRRCKRSGAGIRAGFLCSSTSPVLRCLVTIEDSCRL